MKAHEGRPETNSPFGLIDKQDVGKLTRTGALWSSLQIILRNVLSIGTTAILARLLTPDDYGIMGMVATLTVLLLVFSDMGLSWATIQRREVTPAQVSNLFWINTAAGAVLWLFCIFAAPFVADFYGRTELQDVTIVLGATFLIGGLSAQPFALLRRHMRFRTVAEIEIAAVLAAAIAAVIAALSGFGYWALVIQAIVGQSVRLLLVLARTKFIALPPRRGVGTRQLITFGGLLAINGVLIYVARNLDSVLIGKYWGTEQLGYYGRAYFLMLLPSTLATGALANLMVPALATFQDDTARLGSAYRRAVRVVAFAGCPIALGLALTAPEVVRLVYGERWMAVAPMLVWLSIAGITQPVYNTTGWLFTATGKANLYLVVTILNAVALTLTFLWAAPKGAVAVAAAYGIVMGVGLLFPALWFAHRSANLRLGDTMRTLLPVMVALMLLAAAVTLAGWAGTASGLGWHFVLLLKVAAGVGTYVIATRLFLGHMLREDLLPLLPKGAYKISG